jgi:hypothetical protein
MEGQTSEISFMFSCRSYNFDLWNANIVHDDSFIVGKATDEVLQMILELQFPGT